MGGEVGVIFELDEVVYDGVISLGRFGMTQCWVLKEPGPGAVTW